MAPPIRNKNDSDEYELVKVVAVARHGNRTPNRQLPFVCPRASPFLSKFIYNLEPSVAATDLGLG